MDRTSGLAWEPIEFSQKDLDFMAFMQSIEQDIVHIFEIPPQLLGETHIRTNLLRDDLISNSVVSEDTDK